MIAGETKVGRRLLENRPKEQQANKAQSTFAPACSVLMAVVGTVTHTQREWGGGERQGAERGGGEVSCEHHQIHPTAESLRSVWRTVWEEGSGWYNAWMSGLIKLIIFVNCICNIFVYESNYICVALTFNLLPHSFSIIK